MNDLMTDRAHSDVVLIVYCVLVLGCRADGG